MPEAPQYVAVFGGGVAGAVVALSLRKHSIPVVWVLNPTTRRRSFPDHFTPRAVRSLRAQGVENILDPALHLRSSGVISYWGGAKANVRDYMFDPFGAGWNVDRRVFDRMLQKAALRQGVEIIETTQIPLLEDCGAYWHVDAGRDSGFKAGFLIDSTGRNSAISRRLGGKIKKHDRLIALAGFFQAKKQDVGSVDSRLLLEPSRDGWWYSMTMRDNRRVAVFMTDSDLLPCGPIPRAEYWKSCLKEARETEKSLEKYNYLGEVEAAVANSQHLEPLNGNKWIAIGDAWIAPDPLSGHGLEYALNDGVSAACAITVAMAGDNRQLNEILLRRSRFLADYFESRKKYYQIETRWAESEFWRRRHFSK